MADEVDMATEIADEHLRSALSARREAPTASPSGVCATCELESPRLFAGECAWCHDGRERPEAAQPEPAFTIRGPYASTDPAPPPARKSRYPNSGKGQGYRPALVAGRFERRQLNAHFSPDQYAVVEARAAAEGKPVSAWARAVVLDAIEPVPAFDARRKPFIPAAAIRAARDAGQPLDVFVTALIARGLASFQADTSNEGAS